MCIWRDAGAAGYGRCLRVADRVWGLSSLFLSVAGRLGVLEQYLSKTRSWLTSHTTDVAVRCHSELKARELCLELQRSVVVTEISVAQGNMRWALAQVDLCSSYEAGRSLQVNTSVDGRGLQADDKWGRIATRPMPKRRSAQARLRR